MTDFARPVKELLDSGIPNSIAPTAGMGLTLSTQGRIPASVLSTVYSTWPTGTPDPNEEFIYEADSTNGVYWRLKYVASQPTYNWVCLSGVPLSAAVDTAETTASTTYAALTTAGPSVALPRAGDYLIEVGCYQRTTTAGASALMSYDIGGTGAIDGNSVQVDSAIASAGSHVYRRRRLTGFAAVTLTSKYRVSAGTGTFGSRFLSALPLRLS